MPRYTRLSVDIDDVGAVVGASYERRDEGGELLGVGTVRLGCEMMHGALEAARRQAEQDLGVQLELWP